MEEKKVFLGDPSPAMTFIFTMITGLFWAWFAGVYRGSVFLPIGVVQLACFPAYLIGAIIFYQRGESLLGIVFTIFATLFGGIGGLLNVVTHFGIIYNWGLDASVSAIPFIWGGISMIPVCYILRKIPLLTLLVYINVAVFLIVYGLVTLAVLPASLLVACKWMALFIAVAGLYTCLDGILQAGGCKGLPCGPSIFK